MLESLGNRVAYSLLGLEAGSALGDAIQLFVTDVARIFVLSIVVIYVMGLLRAMLSPRPRSARAWPWLRHWR